MKVEARRRDDGLAQGHVAGKGDDGDTAARDGGLHGDFEYARHLIGLRDEFAVVAALRKQMLRIGLLKILAADFVAGDLRGDGENGVGRGTMWFDVDAEGKPAGCRWKSHNGPLHEAPIAIGRAVETKK